MDIRSDGQWVHGLDHDSWSLMDERLKTSRDLAGANGGVSQLPRRHAVGGAVIGRRNTRLHVHLHTPLILSSISFSALS